MAAHRRKPWGVGAVALVVLMAACNNPINDAVSVTASDTTPFGNGQTVYVGFPNTDWYHTGVLKYASNGTGWIQQLSSQVAVTDISVDSSGNMAVAANTILYRPSGGSWSSSTLTGIRSVGTVSTTVAATDASNFYVFASSNLTSATSTTSVTNPTCIFVGDATHIYIGTSSGVSFSSGAASSNLVASPSTNISGLYASGGTAYAVTSTGYSTTTNSGSSWSTVTATTIGLGTPQCIWVSGGTIYLGTSLGVAVSSDNGVTWKVSNLQTSVTSISAATSNGVTCLYAATAQGLYVYSFSTKSWTLAFSGYPVNKVYVTVP